MVINMTLEEARHIRNVAGKLYKICRRQYFRIYYQIYNKKPGDDEDFDAYVSSCWDQSDLADSFHELGAYGYQRLMDCGWNPFKDPNEEEPLHPLDEDGNPT